MFATRERESEGATVMFICICSEKGTQIVTLGKSLLLGRRIGTTGALYVVYDLFYLLYILNDCSIQQDDTEIL